MNSKPYLPSERIEQIARERYSRPVCAELPGVTDFDAYDPRAVVDFLDELIGTIGVRNTSEVSR